MMLCASQTYHSGVYTPTNCYGGIPYLDHAILVVGYGVSGSQPYWLMQNRYN